MKSFIAATLVIGFLIFSLPCLAEEEIPVNIKAEKLKYVENSDLVTASGSVEIVLKEVVIHSDDLVMDTKTNVITAEGNVRLSGPEYDGQGTSLTYFVNDETSSFKNFKTTVSPSEVKGHIYMGADDIQNLRSKWLGREGDLTTCDYVASDAPHYFVAARKVEYYPDDKIVGYSVTFYIGRVPCLWAPYMVYDLKRKRKRNWSIGHNEVEGNFIKTFWDYPSGIILLDLMEKKGWGKGFEHYYDLKRYGAGTFYLYQVDEPDTHLTDWVYKINHTLKLTSESTLNLGHSFSKIYLVPGGRLDQSTYRLDFSHQKKEHRLNSLLDVLDNRGGQQERYNISLNNSFKGYQTSYSFNLDQGKVEPRSIRSSQRLSHQQPLLNEYTDLNLNANYTNAIPQVGLHGDERMDLSYTLTNRGSFYNLTVYEDWYLDLDRNLYLGDENDQYLEKQPEIALSLHPYDLKIFNLSPSFGYGYYHEVRYVTELGGNRDFKAGRYSTALSLDKSLPMILGTTLSLGYGVTQYLYEPGDMLYAQTERAGLNTSLFNCFRNNVDFNRGLSEGNSPFFFDRLGTKYSHIRDTLNLYYQDYVNWTLSGGFNYETRKHFNWDTSLTLRPDPALNASYRTSWDIENQIWLDLVSGYRLMPFKGLTDDTTLVQDLNTGQLKSGSNLLDWEIGSEQEWENHWHFKLGHVYNPSNQEFKLVDVMIAKDLHCWEIKYLYSDYRKEFSLIFTLKALPGEPIGYAEGKGFYFDSIEKSFKEEFEGASPQRY